MIVIFSFSLSISTYFYTILYYASNSKQIYILNMSNYRGKGNYYNTRRNVFDKYRKIER